MVFVENKKNVSNVIELEKQNDFLTKELKNVYLKRGTALIEYYYSTGIYNFELPMDELTLVKRVLQSPAEIFIGNDLASRRFIKLFLKLDNSPIFKSKIIRVPIRKSFSALIRAKRLYKKIIGKNS